ncbi:MAG: cytochrome c oxidase assembly protein [Actinomycetes bacterium]
MATQLTSRPEQVPARVLTSLPRRAVPAAVVAGLLALVGGMLLTGAAAPLVLGDPGRLVRWGLPVSRAVQDAAGALTLGGLLLAGTALPAASAAFRRSVAIASAAATLWTLAGAGTVLLTYADIAGRPVTEPSFGSELATFVLQIELTRYLLIGVLIAALVSALAFVVRTPLGAGVVALLAAAAWFPVALTGHAAGASNHELAVSGWWLHALGVGVWFGGLAVLVLLRPRLGAELPDVADRFSTLAGYGFALVVVSGVANAWLRLEEPSDLLHGYGLLVLGKIVATLLLGAAGWTHRRTTLAGLRSQPARQGFWRLVAGELVVFGLTLGLAVALSRSRPPVPVDVVPPDRTPAQILTGELLPPPLTVDSWFTEWRPDLLWLVIAVAAAATYVAGIRTLWRRGDRWPLWRAALWLLGCALLVFLTSGGPAEYGRVLFSAHMLQHMLLSMAVPSLLVFGAPVTLALRALPRRRDGSKGPREWLLTVIGSPYVQFFSHPVVAAVVFAGSLMAFYWSELFPLALSTHLGHELMMVHFLLAGYLFVQAVVGVDPGPKRPGHLPRLVLLLATMVFHGFFGVAIMSSDTLLAATWFSSLGWGIDALADQQNGGGIAWGVGEFPTLILAMVVAVQWARSDDREARRQDRAADRNHDADLVAYNDILARMAAADRRARARD